MKRLARVKIMAVLACTCQVFKCLIKGSFWGWRSFISTGTGSFAQRTGWHRWALLSFPSCSWASPNLTPAVLPPPSPLHLPFAVQLHFMSCQKERKQDWLCGCWIWDGTFDWWNNYGVCFHYLPKTPLTDYDPHSCALLALFVCNWPICYFHLLFFFFKFTSYVLKSNSHPIAPFLFFLYAAYLMWKIEGLVLSTC